MSKIILQPAGDKDAREHYNDTLENPVELDRIYKFLSQKNKEILSDIYPDKKCYIWGVTPSGNNITKWNKIESGDVTLFSRNKRIYASGVTTYKLHNQSLAAFLWDYNNKGQTWEYIYFLDEIRNHSIPYIDFNKSVGYKENYIIQGFNVLDELKSKSVFDDFGLESSTYIPLIEQEEYKNVAVDIAETEKSYTAIRRLEQGYLRKRLFGNKTTAKCSCCNKVYPISMLWCSHIKKRKDCNDEEKRDFNVVLPMCKFGCDELYEKGYIGVRRGNIIQIKDNELTDNLQSYIDSVIDNNCSSWNDNTKHYFDWHYKNWS